MCISHKDLLEMQNHITDKMDADRDRMDIKIRRIDNKMDTMTEQIHELDVEGAVLFDRVKSLVRTQSTRIAIVVSLVGVSITAFAQFIF